MGLEVLWFEIWTLKVGTAKDHLNTIKYPIYNQIHLSFLEKEFFEKLHSNQRWKQVAHTFCRMVVRSDTSLKKI